MANVVLTDLNLLEYELNPLQLFTAITDGKECLGLLEEPEGEPGGRDLDRDSCVSGYISAKPGMEVTSVLKLLLRAVHHEVGEEVVEEIGHRSGGCVGLFNSVDGSHIVIGEWGLRHMAQIAIGQEVVVPPQPALSFAAYVPKDDTLSSRLTGGNGRFSTPATDKALCSPVYRVDETSPPCLLHAAEMIADVRTPRKSSYSIPSDEDNVVFRNLRRNPRNLILDSTCPELAPHIVITPAEHSWVDLVVMQENAIPPQWLGYLTVPPDDLRYDAMPSSAVEMVTECEQMSECCALEPVPIERSFRCFSLSKFSELIAKGTMERHTRYHLMPVVNKRLYAICASSASVKGSTLQARHDSPHYNPFQHLEKQFKWTDPAIPVLAEARKYLGTLIIDSITPSITPHIIINEPPPYDNDPYVQFYNSTQNPQDCAFGRHLIVPSRLVEIINILHRHQEQDQLSDTYVFDSVMPISSIPPTPSLFLPTEEGDEPDSSLCSSSSANSFFEEYEEAKERNAVQYSNKFDTNMDEDDDDLPPLDDWYLQIASRTGLTITF